LTRSYYSTRTPHSHSANPSSRHTHYTRSYFYRVLKQLNTQTQSSLSLSVYLSLTEDSHRNLENPRSKSVMGDSRVFPDPISTLHRRSNAGIIKRIRLENFMCHDNLQIELGEWVNFITGQNGSKGLPLSICLCQLRTKCEMQQINKSFFIIYFLRF
jgi:hypothetical protein